MPRPSSFRLIAPTRFAKAVLGALLFVPALLPACATGGDATGEAIGDVTPQSEGGAPVDPCKACTTDQTCQNGMCIALTSDRDGDGYPAATDCNDSDPAIHPGAAEVCNGKDDDCNKIVDDGFDEDNDGYFRCAVGGKEPDCDDKNPAVNPGAKEACNNVDDNCDGKIDEGFDKDDDGFYSCARGTIAADCNDDDATIHPGAPEVCNGKDDDCSGKADDIAITIDSNNPPGSATLRGGLASLVAPNNDVHWAAAGSGRYGNTLPAPTPGWFLLTDDIPDQAGALWWNASYVFDNFDMSAGIWIQNKPTGADGMTFAWIAGSNLTALGNGAGYGVVNIPGGGYAVVIDTYQNTGEGAVPYLSVIRTDNPGAPIATVPGSSLPPLRTSSEHALRVQLSGGKVTVSIDGVIRMNAVTIPGYAPFTGHWGFTAGTGGSSEQHWVRNIKMTFPEQGCVP